MFYDVGYIFYGVAFLAIGLSITVVNMKESHLKLADYLWLLGLFGYTQFARACLYIYPLMAEDPVTIKEIFAIELFSLLLLTLSFALLLIFGLSLVTSAKGKRLWWLMAIPAALFGVSVVLHLREDQVSRFHLLRHIENTARNTLGLAGGLTTAWGLIIGSRETKKLSNPISRYYLFAGLAFVVYSIMVSPRFADLTIEKLHMPGEFFRGGVVILITFFIIKALNIFNIDMRRRVEIQARFLVHAEKLTSLGQLAAGIAHEINNPLANASMGLYRLKSIVNNGGTRQEVEERFQAVENNIKRASSIAQELLQFSRQGEFELNPLNINEVIEHALNLLKHKINSVEVRWDPGSVPDVMGNRRKLEQVFINVFSNSLEAMPDGGVLSISTTADKDHVEACIVDTGAGIARKDLPRVFEPFFTTKEIGSGTGLGLSISYGIIKQHNGTLRLSSTEGKGTTVVIKIPVVKS